MVASEPVRGVPISLRQMKTEKPFPAEPEPVRAIPLAPYRFGSVAGGTGTVPIPCLLRTGSVDMRLPLLAYSPLPG
jgi:hypothetical protein